MRNRTWIGITLFVVLSWVLGGICQAEEVTPGIPGSVLLGSQLEEPGFDAQAVNEWMRRYVQEYPPEPIATDTNCPPGFDCAGLQATPGLRASVEKRARMLDTMGEVHTYSAVSGAEVRCSPGFDCRKPEGFFGLPSLALGAFMFGGAAWDVKTSMDVFGLEGTHTFMEHGQPVSRTFVAFEISGPEERFIRKGIGGFAGFKAAINIPVWVASHFMRRSDKLWLKVLGWTLPIALGSIQYWAGFENRTTYHEVRSQLGY